MTQGKAGSLLIRFSLPALAGNLLNQAYTITDSIIVGKHLGNTALAAVGCTMPIILVLAAVMIGMNISVSVLLSQAFGAKNLRSFRETFANSLYLGLFLSGVIALVGTLLAEPVLRWMNTPEGPLEQATIYLKISVLTTGCPLFYYLFASAFRSMGDSNTVLLCLIVSVVGNIFLDILFVIVLGWGVAGSAWATALAQLTSVAFSAIMFFTKHPQIRLTRQDLRPRFSIIGKIAGTAVPMALQTAFNNLGNIIAQSGVNCFGEVAMTAYTAGSRIGSLSLMPAETIGGSLSIYAGQNFGAKKNHRIHLGVKAALVQISLMSTVIAALLLLFGKPLASLFLMEPTPEVLDCTGRYLLITAVPGVLAGFMNVYQQVLRGVNKATVSMLGGLMQLLSKILVVALGAWVYSSMDLMWLAWPISFLMGTVLPWICYRRLRTRMAAEESPSI